MDAIDLMFLKYAAKNYHIWGRWATVRYCAKRGISRGLLTLARFGELHSAVVDMLTNGPDYKCTEEFASDLIYIISNASELLDTITSQSIALDESRWQLRDFLSTNAR